MELKKLGKTNIKVPPITFGGNVFGWTADEKMSFKLLDELFERGFNFIDSANVYSIWHPGNKGGESEEIIGKWMKTRGNRDKVIVTTKLGYLNKATKAVLSPENIHQQIKDSLQRLQTDYIDVYFSHTFDAITPIIDTLNTYNELVNEGKIRSLGASNFPFEKFVESQNIAKQNGFNRYEAYQPEFSLVAHQSFEENYQQYCVNNMIGVTGYFTLASGFLTGKYSDISQINGTSREPFLKKYFTDTGYKILKALDTVSKKHSVSPSAVAIAWTLTQPGITSPIASASRPDHLQSFYEAVKLELNNEDLELLGNN